MKINALDVEGFGIWSGLKLDGMSDGLCVFWGPNEAGKTTLMQFVRSVLYGFTNDRRRYLPPVGGGRPGGTIDVAGPDGRFRITRHDDDPDGAARAIVSTPDGALQAESRLKTLLANVDEPIFNNVFAVGLREMQELGTLGDTEAAELLFNITAGLDRVSLVDAMRELNASRNRLLDRDGKPCQIHQLIEERDRLQGELDELGSLTTEYTRLAGQRDSLDRDVARLEDDKKRCEHDARLVEIAVNVRERFGRRSVLDRQLAAMSLPGAVPAGALKRLDRLRAQLAHHRDRIAAIGRRRKSLRVEAAGLKVNETLWRQSARVEAFQGQETWLSTLRTRIAELENETFQTESQLVAERDRLGLGAVAGAAGAIDLAAVAGRKMGRVRRAASDVRQVRQKWDEARQQADAARTAAQGLAAEIDASLGTRGEKDLHGAIDRAGSLVTQLRRRVQLDERLGQMNRNHAELDEQSRHLLQRQLMPIRLVIGLGLVFVFGVILLAAGLVAPSSVTGGFGWAMVILGATGAGIGLGAKTVLERTNARKLDACQKQINMLQLQLQQAAQERDDLDRTLGAGSPASNRLAEAESVLSGLESLVPLETRRQTARQEADATEARHARIDEEFKTARRRWREALASVGLPENLSTKQVRQLLRRGDHLTQLTRRLTRCREELDARRAELDGLGDRIAKLATETGVVAATSSPIELLRQLSEAVRRQEALMQHRDRLRRQSRKLRRRRSKLDAAVRRLKRRRRNLFVECGARNEAELRDRSRRFAEVESLRRDRQAIQAEIDAALGGHATEDAIAPILAGGAETDLEARWESLEKQVHSAEAQLRDCLQQRGHLAARLAALAEDRRPAAKQLQLAMVQQQLADAVRRWQVLAVTCRILEWIKETYETERQPETLQEASGYLRRLTNGRYARVWTPLGEDVLRVDDAQGQSLAVESLSRGTREQLFLSLRLALASSYARRGASLPLVLDDVLVNFDSQRAKAAAAVLCDFAQAGHQVLVFTCHDHIYRLFQSLKVEVRRLPGGVEEVEPAERRRSAKKKRRKDRRRRPAPEPVIALDDLPEYEAAEPVETASEDVLWVSPEDDPGPWIDDEAHDDVVDYEEPQAADDFEFRWIEDEDLGAAEAA